MVSGRALYGEVADAALVNSRELLRNARRLKSLGSRGHALSLAVLSIEESSKAIIYNMAANGIIRIVKNNPNNVTTFRKDDLRNHRFKHNLVRGYLADWLEYLPFRIATTDIRKSRLTKSEVEMIIQRAIYSHKHLKLNLGPGGKAEQGIKELFELLLELDSMKNKCLYIDHTPNRVLVPNDVTKEKLVDVVELADLFIDITSGELSREMNEKEKRMHRVELRELAREARARKSPSGKKP